MAKTSTDSQISSRYAAALFALAQEQKKLDAVAGDLTSLAALVKDSNAFAALCYSPVIPRRVKIKAVEALIKKMKWNATTAQFLKVLAENQRLAALPAIAEAFSLKLREHKGEMVAEVLTAAKLDASTEKSLTAHLSKYTGKTVTLDVKQKPEILGGLTIRLGGVMIDTSISGKLNRLKEKLNQGIKQVA